jgi:hypothetical protein
VKGGKFIVLTPDRLILYSADLQALRQLDVSLSRLAPLDEWTAFLSPGRAALLLEYYPEKPDLKWVDHWPATEAGSLAQSEWLKEQCQSGHLWIDTENLAVLRKWEWQGKSDQWTESISDEHMATSLPLRISRPGGPWQAVVCPGFLRRGCGSPAQFVSNSSMLVGLYRPERKALVTTDGEVLFMRVLLPNQIYGRGGCCDQYPARPSADGRRFAIPISDIKGYVPALDIGGKAVLNRIEVYDLPSRQWIQPVNAKQRRIKNISGLALSPDGTLLGLITSDGVLEVYRLP